MLILVLLFVGTLLVVPLASSAAASEFNETYNNTPGPNFLNGSPGILTNSNGRIQKHLSLEHMKENSTFYEQNEYGDELGFKYNEQNYSGFEEF
ncbi:hypothetical protein Tco_1221242 [Tanacetum coccineum]